MSGDVAAEFSRIKSVRAYIPGPAATDAHISQSASSSHGADCHDVIDEHWINGHPTPIANPMSGYKAYAASRKSWGINALGTIVVCVEAEDGTTGVGVSIGGEPGQFIYMYNTCDKLII